MEKEKSLTEQVSFDESFDLGDFDIRNADGSIGVPLPPGQSRVMLSRGPVKLGLRLLG